MSVEFTDFSEDVKSKIEVALIAGLHEAAGELEGQVKMNVPIDKGQLKNSWSYKVNESNLEATVGSPLENAVWNEFGTGQYALNGDGRKTAWTYQDDKGNWHKTKGKRPQRSLNNAFITKKNTMIGLIQNKIKDL